MGRFFVLLKVDVNNGTTPSHITVYTSHGSLYLSLLEHSGGFDKSYYYYYYYYYYLDTITTNLYAFFLE